MTVSLNARPPPTSRPRPQREPAAAENEAPRTLELTATDYELLRVLSPNAGRVVKFDTLLLRVWSKREHVAVGVLRIFVRNLRLKLGDSADSPAYIFNQRGVGYRMAAPSGSRQRPVASSGEQPATDDGT